MAVATLLVADDSQLSVTLSYDDISLEVSRVDFVNKTGRALRLSVSGQSFTVPAGTSGRRLNSLGLTFIQDAEGMYLASFFGIGG